MSEFQSRSGFSGRLDGSTSKASTYHTAKVSIPFWVFWSSRQQRGGWNKAGHEVSIPFWVFWSSRPANLRAQPRGLVGFNPVLGFLVVSTEHFDNPIRPDAFQSRSGFSGRLDLIDIAREQNLIDMFQSRSGFSGRLDNMELCGSDPGDRVSIPFWVFWSSRP